MSHPTFIDRRQAATSLLPAMRERRQFADGHDQLSPAVRELAEAIDRYKLEYHRRFVDYKELLGVILSLGYRKESDEIELVQHDVSGSRAGERVLAGAVH